jgi:hypothetical protein
VQDKKISLIKGDNTVDVIVHGSLKNTFGPHHKVTRRGLSAPGDFKKAPEKQPSGSEYDMFDYGLLEDFKVYALK